MSNTFCNFHVSDTYNGTKMQHVIFPYCGCGWVGEVELFNDLDTADVVAMAYRWERHRVQFATRQRSMRSLVP